MLLDAENDFAGCWPPSSLKSDLRPHGVVGRRRRSTPRRRRRRQRTSTSMMSSTSAELVRSYRETEPCRSRRQIVVIDARFYAGVSCVSAAYTVVTSTNCKVTAAAVRATDGDSRHAVNFERPSQLYQLQTTSPLLFRRSETEAFLLLCSPGA